MSVGASSAATRPVPGTLSVRELLEHDSMTGAQLIAGSGGLDRRIARLNFMSVPDIVPWTRRDEFLLTTGYPLPRGSEGFAHLIEQLAGNGLAGLGIKLDQYLAKVPAGALSAADAVGFPIVVIPRETALDDVLSQAFATIVNRQARALQVTQEIHQTLLGVALTGGGLKLLVKELSGILGCAAVAVVEGNGAIRAATDDLGPFQAASLLAEDGSVVAAGLRPGLHEDGAGPRWIAAAISAGHLKHGFVVAIEGVERPLRFSAIAAVEQAALVAALEITKDIAVASVERQFASNALHDLVMTGASDVVDPVAHAVTFGWDLDRPLAVLVAREDSTANLADATSPRARELAALRAASQWTSVVRRYDSHAAVAAFATELVAVVGPGDVGTFARHVHADMAGVSAQGISIGASRVGASVADVPRLYQEARTARSVGQRLSGAGSVTCFADLGVYRLLSSVAEGDLRAFVDEALGPVLELPLPARADLLETLDALFEYRFNVAETARNLHYHYNTLRYRVGKLETLLSPFVDDAEASLRIGVALRILRMHEISNGSLASWHTRGPRTASSGGSFDAQAEE